jgi:oligopeptide/dipeptide ABC transporter ATP-binding protein
VTRASPLSPEPFGAEARQPQGRQPQGRQPQGRQPEGGPLLVVDDLRTWFPTARGTVRAVDGVSFTVEQGSTLGVVGESGSGKTVLARSIMGLLPRRDSITSGAVHFAGRDLTAMAPAQLRNLWGAEMSMVFQDPTTALNPVKRIGVQITETLRPHLKMGRSEATAAAVELLRSVGIPSPEVRIRWYPFQLSGGMRQRVMIAIALACAPRLVLADEPTTGLDVTVQAQILDLLAESQRQRQMAMILITHDLSVVANRADHIVVMYAGRIVEQGPTVALFGDTRMPYTQALIDSIPRLSSPSGSRLRTIPGQPPDLVRRSRGCRFAPRCPYAQDKCRQSEPPLRTAATPDHLFACWYPMIAGVSTAPSAASAVTIGRRSLHEDPDPVDGPRQDSRHDTPPGDGDGDGDGTTPS